MISSNRELKARARCLLPGHYSVLIISLLTAELLFSVTAGIFTTTGAGNSILISILSTLIIWLLYGVIHAGLHWQQLNLVRERKVRIADIFYCFRAHPDRAIIITFLLILINVVLSLPAIAVIFFFVRNYAPVSLIGQELVITIPPLREAVIMLGILLIWLIVIAAVNLHYAMAYYLFIDDPENGAVATLRQSRTLMQGHKFRLARLFLSFAGLILLGILSLGIGLLWVFPYMSASETCFYQELIHSSEGLE